MSSGVFVEVLAKVTSSLKIKKIFCLGIHNIVPINLKKAKNLNKKHVHFISDDI